MIARPKLPAELPHTDVAALETALAMEGVELAPAWASQTAARVTFDTVSLLDPDLTGARLRQSSWTDVQVARGQLGGLDLTGTSWRRVEVSAARLSGIVLAEAELRDVTFTDCKFDLANLRQAKLARVHFVRCQLDEVDLAAATLADVIFTDCDLPRADFTGSRMKQVQFPASRLSDLRGISGLSGSKLTNEQIILLAPELAASLGIIGTQ